MTFELSHIVPWGRNFNEYSAMFDLSLDDLKGSILGCGDGPASFNYELTQHGGKVISVDPIYEFTAAQIKERIDETFAQVMSQTRKNKHEFVWTTIRSIEELGRVRMEAMQKFLADFEQGKVQGRYVCGQLPKLNFVDRQFTLALSSHFLFLYSKSLDFDFHIEAIREMCRVAREVRIFPLLELGATLSPHVLPVIEHFKNDGYEVEVVEVDYEFQRGGNQMLKVRNVI
jgi:hypothetical protein